MIKLLEEEKRFLSGVVGEAKAEISDLKTRLAISQETASVYQQLNQAGSWVPSKDLEAIRYQMLLNIMLGLSGFLSDYRFVDFLRQNP